MAFLAQIIAFMLQWILTLGGKAAYEWTQEYIRKQEERKREKKHLKDYEETRKKGEKSDEMLNRETDILNG
jgi:hypothetical protein